MAEGEDSAAAGVGAAERAAAAVPPEELQAVHLAVDSDPAGEAARQERRRPDRARARLINSTRRSA